MAYVLNPGGVSPDGLDFGFTTAIANFALQSLHESQGLVDYTRVVSPNQGDTYLVPNFAAITYSDYNPSIAPGTGFGPTPAAPLPPASTSAFEQTPALTQTSIQATPAVAATAFDVFAAWTTSFELAATLGEELGGSYGEKVDQRVAGAFAGFKATVGNTLTAPGMDSPDGFPTVIQLGAMELLPSAAAPAGATAGFSANTVLELVRLIKQNYTVGRLPGTPIVVLDSTGNDGVIGSSMIRALSELSGGAVGTAGTGGSAITSLGEELLSTGSLTNLYGCRIIFSNFLPTISRNIAAQGAADCLVGAYFHETAIFTVLKEGLQIKMGEKPGGLQMWLTGLAYFGSGVADPRRGGAINIQQV
jgi:hypothetical protein